MPEKIKEFCPHCGATMQKHRHTLGVKLVEVLQDFARAIKVYGRNDIHIQTEMDLDHNQYNNFQKLRYFGLIHHADKENKHNGRWLLTKLGGQFLRAEAPCRDLTITYRNVIDHELTDQYAKMVWIFDFYRSRAKEYWQTDFAFTAEIEQGKLF